MKKLIDFGKTVVFLGINLFARIAYVLLMICPIKKNCVFVNVYDGNGIGDHPKYIVNHLMQINNEVKIYWLSKEKKKPEGRICFVKKGTINALYRMATSRIWISTVRMPLYAKKKKRQFYLQTWHGSIPLKRIEADCEESLSRRYVMQAMHDSKMIDVIITNSRFRTNNFRTAFWYDGDIMEFGSPRSEVFYNESEIKSIRKNLGLEDDVKIALYAPTFRGKTTLVKLDIDYAKLKSTLQNKFGGKWIVAVRIHPKIINQCHKLDNENVINFSKIPNAQDVLAVSDVIISDYSGLMFDVIEVYKPVFIYANDIAAYQRDRNFYFNLNELPFSVAQNNLELIDNIMNFDENDYKKQVDDFINKVGLIVNPESAYDVAKFINSKINEN